MQSFMAVNSMGKNAALDYLGESLAQGIRDDLGIDAYEKQLAYARGDQT